MKIAPLADVKARLSAYLKMCAEAPVIVTKNGRPAAVLVAVSNEEDLERLVLGHTPRFMAILDSAERRIKKGKESLSPSQCSAGAVGRAGLRLPASAWPPKAWPRSVARHLWVRPNSKIRSRSRS